MQATTLVLVLSNDDLQDLGTGSCRCFTIDSLPRGYLGQYVRASAYAELDGERRRQSIYSGLGPRL